MLRKISVILLLVGLVSVTGCLTKPLAAVEEGVTWLITFDDPVSTWVVYGGDSEEYQDAARVSGERYRSYQRNLNDMWDFYEKHFLLYDKNDPYNH
jgi:hypothetical protein